VAGRGIPTFLRALEHQGISLRELSTAARISEDVIRTSPVLDYEQGMRLWKAAETLTGDPAVGLHVGAALKADQLGVLGPVFANAADLRSAIDGLCRIFSLAFEGARMTLEDTSVVYVSPRDTGPALIHGVDVIFAGLVSLAREHTGQRVRPAGVTYSLPTPVDRAPYERFYGVTPRWDAARNTVTLEPEALTLPLRGADPSLAAHLLRHADQLLGERGVAPLERDARLAVGRLLRAGRAASLVNVAAELGTSGRSLQRRLRDAGRSFGEVRKGALREHAEALLGDPKLTIEAIAAQLGYANRASFERAFRAWTGRTPAQHRAEG